MDRSSRIEERPVTATVFDEITIRVPAGSRVLCVLAEVAPRSAEHWDVAVVAGPTLTIEDLAFLASTAPALFQSTMLPMIRARQAANADRQLAEMPVSGKPA